MILLTALLLAQAPVALPPPPPRPLPRPRPVAALTASAFVEVLRAERIGEVQVPGALLRQVRRESGVPIVEFD